MSIPFDMLEQENAKREDEKWQRKKEILRREYDRLLTAAGERFAEKKAHINCLMKMMENKQ